jgi:hypothetical protein
MANFDRDAKHLAEMSVPVHPKATERTSPTMDTSGRSVGAFREPSMGYRSTTYHYRERRIRNRKERAGAVSGPQTTHLSNLWP